MIDASGELKVGKCVVLQQIAIHLKNHVFMIFQHVRVQCQRAQQAWGILSDKFYLQKRRQGELGGRIYLPTSRHVNAWPPGQTPCVAHKKMIN